MQEILKIPKERIAVLIGKKGKEKKKVEENTKTKISVDSKTGEVEVEGKDAVLYYICIEIVKAVGRGFNPKNAMLLLDEKKYLDLIDLEDFVSGKEVERVKGRIIGRNGRAWKEIEEKSGAKISVYGNTVGIIGDFEETEKARTAVEMLIEGREHENVYNFLKKEETEDFEL